MSDNESRQIDYNPSSDISQEQRDGEVYLLQLWEVIWRGKLFIAGFTLVSTLIAVYITLFVMTEVYKSEAVLVPTETDNNAIGKLAGLAGNLPIPIDLPGTGGKANSIFTFLNSRTLKERLLTNYDLLPRFYPGMWDGKRGEWLVENQKDRPSVIKFLQSKIPLHEVAQDRKSNLIILSWEDEDPAFAALMLNRTIKELKFYLDNEYETDAKREREFVENQLANMTRELKYWEKQIPNKDLNLATIQRERMAAQTVYAELRKQMELAKISEAKELIGFKVLDPPFVPEQRFKPKRSRICMLTMAASGMLAVFIVLLYSAFGSRRNQDKKRISEH